MITGDSGVDVGVAWYRREDYPRIREIMVDRDALHDTYDEWLADLENLEFRLALAGHEVTRIPIYPQEFLAWCLLRSLNPDASARSRFASEAVRAGSTPP